MVSSYSIFKLPIYLLKKKEKTDVLKSTWETTKKFIPKVETSKYIKVIKVYDGDTITVVAKPYKEQEVCRFSIRLYGLDTPEIKSKKEEEKEAGLFVRDKVSELILNKLVKLKIAGSDKYGRLLANVWVDDMNINEWLLRNEYAMAYDGGTKQEMTIEFLEKILSKTRK